jgi:DNA-binding cell septation regulator SpoVG
MEIKIKHFGGQYPSFNVALHTSADSEAFLEIKGCRIADGKNGPFVSYPSRKTDDGKYWNHVYGSEAFNANVLKRAQREAPAPAPRPAPPPKPAPAQANSGGFEDMADDIPFNNPMRGSARCLAM